MVDHHFGIRPRGSSEEHNFEVLGSRLEKLVDKGPQFEFELLVSYF
jgi:hypothetical protein